MPRDDISQQAKTIFGIIQMVSAGVLFPLFTLLFIRNRKLHPINGRTPLVVASFDVLQCFYLIHIAQIVMNRSYPCPIRVWLDFLLGFCSMGIYAFRFTSLLFHHEITKNLAEYHECKEKNKNDFHENWYVQHRHWMSLNNLIRVGVAIVGMYILMLMILTTARPELQTIEACNPSMFQKIFYVVTALHIIYIGIIGFLLRHHHNDGFSIKLEFHFALGFVGVAFIIKLVGEFAYGVDWFWSWAALSLAAWGTFGVGTVWPFLMSLKDYSHIEKDARMRMGSLNSRIVTADVEHIRLSEFLSLPGGFESFLAYLRSEFNSENLLMWSAVDEFHKIDPSLVQQVKTRALEIYSNYIVKGAPFEINIGSQMRQQIDIKIKKLKEDGVSENSLTMFDDVQKEAFELMQKDPFMRFRHTQPFIATVTQENRNTLTSISPSMSGTPLVLRSRDTNHSTADQLSDSQHQRDHKDEVSDLGASESSSLPKPVTPTTSKSQLELTEFSAQHREPLSPPGLEKIDSVPLEEDLEEEKRIQKEILAAQKRETEKHTEKHTPDITGRGSSELDRPGGGNGGGSREREESSIRSPSLIAVTLGHNNSIINESPSRVGHHSSHSSNEDSDNNNLPPPDRLPEFGSNPTLLKSLSRSLNDGYYVV